MNGGEDYELLFTVPLADNEKVSQLDGIRIIGYITKPELGLASSPVTVRNSNSRHRVGIRCANLRPLMPLS